MTRKPFRRIMALLLLPLLLLAGCKSTSSIEIKDENNIVVTSDLALSKAEAGQFGMNKDKLCASTKETNKSFKNLKQEAYEEGDHIGCRFSGTTTINEMNGSGADSPALKHDRNAKKWTFSIPQSSTGGAGMDGLKKMVTDFKFTVTFPGKVTKANKGKIEGNSVVFTDVADVLGGDIQVEAEDAGGFLWLPLLLGLLALAVLGGLAWYFLGRKKTAAAPRVAQTPAPTQSYLPQATPTPAPVAPYGTAQSTQTAQPTAPIVPQGGQYGSTQVPPASAQDGQVPPAGGQLPPAPERPVQPGSQY